MAKFWRDGKWLTWQMPGNACPCLDHGCPGEGCKCFCHENHVAECPKCGLRYIANSPPKERGGFHENAIETARLALEYIEQLERRLG